MPQRVKRQLFDWNRLVGVLRFTFRILRKALPGKAVAYEAEDEAVDAFIEKRGRPRGMTRIKTTPASTHNKR